MINEVIRTGLVNTEPEISSPHPMNPGATETTMHPAAAHHYEHHILPALESERAQSDHTPMLDKLGITPDHIAFMDDLRRVGLKP
jgi:hypothetical protein